MDVHVGKEVRMEKMPNRIAFHQKLYLYSLLLTRTFICKISLVCISTDSCSHIIQIHAPFEVYSNTLGACHCFYFNEDNKRLGWLKIMWEDQVIRNLWLLALDPRLLYRKTIQNFCIQISNFASCSWSKISWRHRSYIKHQYLTQIYTLTFWSQIAPSI